MADEIKREPGDLSAEVARRADATTERRQKAKVAEAASLDQVQRALISALILVVIATPAVVVDVYVVHAPGLLRSDVIGLWIMSGVTGLIAAAGVLFVNRRRPYSPLVALGLLPMAVTAFWVF